MPALADQPGIGQLGQVKAHRRRGHAQAFGQGAGGQAIGAGLNQQAIGGKAVFLGQGLAVLTEVPAAEVVDAVLPLLRELVADGLVR